MLKLVVTDVDGTLMNDRSEVPLEIFDLIKSMQAQHIRFVVASGRQIKDLKRIFNGLNDIYYIAQNGSYIEVDGIEFRSVVIPTECIKLIVSLAYECGLFPMFYTKDTLLIQDNDPRFIEKLKGYKVDFTYIDKVDFNAEIGKVSLISLDENVGSFKDRFSSLENLDTYLSCADLLDINLANCNKGEALNLIQSKLGITPEETMSFGDAENDIPLFASSLYSYAMMNAPSSVKRYANNIAPSNNANGVVKVLSQVLSGMGC